MFQSKLHGIADRCEMKVIQGGHSMPKVTMGLRRIALLLCIVTWTAGCGPNWPVDLSDPDNHMKLEVDGLLAAAFICEGISSDGLCIFINISGENYYEIVYLETLEERAGYINDTSNADAEFKREYARQSQVVTVILEYLVRNGPVVELCLITPSELSEKIENAILQSGVINLVMHQYESK